MGQTKPHLSNGFVFALLLSELFQWFFFRDKTETEDNDITDIHHHLGGHHKVRFDMF